MDKEGGINFRNRQGKAGNQDMGRQMEEGGGGGGGGWRYEGQAQSFFCFFFVFFFQTIDEPHLPEKKMYS